MLPSFITFINLPDKVKKSAQDFLLIIAYCIYLKVVSSSKCRLLFPCKITSITVQSVDLILSSIRSNFSGNACFNQCNPV